MEEPQRPKETLDAVVTYRVTREEKRLLAQAGRRRKITVAELLRRRTAKDLARERKIVKSDQV